MDFECLLKFECFFFCKNFRPSTPDCAQLCLGETLWLDGLDGKNDKGVIFISSIDDNCVYLLNWSPRTDEDNST